jgi:hypothetical protein
LEESIHDLDQSMKKGETMRKDRPIPPPPPPLPPVENIAREKPIVIEKSVVKPMETNTHSFENNNRCTWRKTPPTNTSFDVEE